MDNAVFAMGSVAAVITLAVAVRTIREREPLWRLRCGLQFGLSGMAVLGVASNAMHSATLDMIGMAYDLAFIAYAMYAWNVQKRFMTGRP